MTDTLQMQFELLVFIEGQGGEELIKVLILQLFSSSWEEMESINFPVCHLKKISFKKLHKQHVFMAEMIEIQLLKF